MRQSLKLLYSEQDKNGVGGGGEGRHQLEVDCGIPRQALAVVKDVNVFRQSDSFSGLLVTIKDGSSSSINVRHPSPLPEFEVMFSPVSGFKRFVSEGALANRITGLEVRTCIEPRGTLLRFLIVTAENFHWTKILSNPATFALQKCLEEYMYIFSHAVKVIIDSM